MKKRNRNEEGVKRNGEENKTDEVERKTPNKMEKWKKRNE